MSRPAVMTEEQARIRMFECVARATLTEDAKERNALAAEADALLKQLLDAAYNRGREDA